MVDRVVLREPYAEPRQQHAAGMMGIYVFLATELMLFGGLFVVALAIRIAHGPDYIMASRALNVWMGGVNTAVLLTSSLAVAIAVHAARAGLTRATVLSLGLAVVLGLAFLVIKGVEYSEEYGEGLLPGFGDPAHFASPVQQQFMNIYLIATGLHAIHLLIGILLLLGLMLRIACRSLALPDRTVVIEVTGVYWHFVDLVWVFLYPALYLAR